MLGPRKIVLIVASVTPDGKLAVVCAVSKQYERAGRRWFWFAFHPHQKEFLKTAQEAYAAFGCGSEKTLLIIPRETFIKWLDGMNRTELEDRFYWHVHIFRDDGRIALYRAEGAPEIDLKPFLLPA